MELVFFLLVLCVIVAVAANTRGRNPAGWLLLSLITSPVIAGLLLLALPRRPRQLSRREILKQRQCPHCLSTMPVSASVCPTCTHESKPISQEQIDAIKRQFGKKFG